MLKQDQMSEDVSASTTLIPAPPPFDPLAANATSATAMVGNSVVPDLMAVYESLTQSKTPDVAPNMNHLLQNQQMTDNRAANGYGSSSHPTTSSGLQQHDISVQQHSNVSNIKPPSAGPPRLQNNDHNQGSSADTQTPSGHDQAWRYAASNIPIPPPVAIPQSSLSRELHSMQPPPPQPTQVMSSGTNARILRKRGPSIVSDEIVPQEEENAYSSSSSVNSSKGGGKKRPKNGNGKKGKKDSDGRWSKRFTWPDDLHRDFVSAIFDVGLKHSSPSTVLEQMAQHEQVTTERIKSHLQKYRLHRQKAKQDFMSDYESTLRRMQQTGYDGIDTLSGGKVAGQVAFATMSNKSTSATSKASSQPKNAVGAGKSAASSTATVPSLVSSSITPPNSSEDVLLLPRLTDVEKNSPLGASMGYLMGLFFSLKQQLDIQREQKQQHEQLLQLREQEQLRLQQEQSHLQRQQEQSQLQRQQEQAQQRQQEQGQQQLRQVGDHNEQQRDQKQQHDASLVATATAAAAAAAAPTVSVANTDETAIPQCAAAAVYDSFVKGLGNEPAQTQYDTSSEQVTAALTLSPGQGATVAHSTRSNLEENNLMKREMKNQMAFQNKMRALKQQEFNKYKVQFSTGTVFKQDSPERSNRSYPQHEHHYQLEQQQYLHPQFNVRHQQAAIQVSNPLQALQEPEQQHQHYRQQDDLLQQEYQDAGETAIDDSGNLANSNALSLGDEDDFWNTDVVDEQLFEFLMNG